MKLTKTEKVILNSYIPVVESLAEYLSNSYEVVLHSLENYDHSVICIINGEHTGRKVGAPITNKALEMLSQITKAQKDNIVYFSKNSNGEPMKSTTIAIHGDTGRIIGLICINLYMNTTLSSFVNSLVPSSIDSLFEEKYTQNTDDLIASAVENETSIVINDNTIQLKDKNKAIVERLYNKGIFKFKDSVIKVADLMNMSKNTIYMHIRNCKK